MDIRRILSRTRSCVQDYAMIQPGDNIAVGLSGGKDSLLLLKTLAGLRRFYPVQFGLFAVTVDMGFPNVDFSPLAAYCQSLEVPYKVVKTDIANVVFNIRKESNPCALCANMRRGSLHSAALELGCRVVALGHHYDDAAETALMNLLFGGRFESFAPVSYLDRRGVTLIRPLLYVGEQLITPFVKDLPILKSPCPADGHTKRQEIKQLLMSLGATYPDIKQRIFHALKKSPDWKQRTTNNEQ